MGKNTTYPQGSYGCSDWTKTLFSLIPGSQNMIGNWIQTVYAQNHTLHHSANSGTLQFDNAHYI